MLKKVLLIFAFSLCLNAKCQPSNLQDSLDVGVPLSQLLQEFPLDSFYCKTFEGGLIFHLDTVENKGYVLTDHDLAVVSWQCNANPCDINANCNDIGAGYSNTVYYMDNCSDSTGPIGICIGLELNGYNDWYLPSRDEYLAVDSNLFSNNCGNLLDIGSGGGYWNSSCDMCCHFFNSANNASDVGFPHQVRAARTFAINTTAKIIKNVASSIKVFPNPVRDKLSIQIPADFEVKRIKIINTLGEVIQEIQITQSEIEIDFFGPSGLYYILFEESSLQVNPIKIVKP